MMRRQIWCVLLMVPLLVGLGGVASAQKRDPLNEKEVDEMRESADWPNKRLELMVQFARARVIAIDQLKADGKKAKDRSMQIHDLLEDFSVLLDEIGDNVEMYGSHKVDMRKGLMLLIEATSEWQLKLRRLKEQSPPEELNRFAFGLANAIDAVNDTAEDARKELQEQNQLAKEKKLTKIYAERAD